MSNDTIKSNSVGVVETQYYTYAGPGKEHKLESGEKLGPITLAYETYGKLNKDKIECDIGAACPFRGCPCSRCSQGSGQYRLVGRYDRSGQGL